MGETAMLFKSTPMSPELTALLEKAKSHVMTPEARRAQRVSFVYGMLPDGDTRSKEDVARWLSEHDGTSDLDAEILRLTSERDTLIEALRVSEAALKPFADTVFNDNGDVTITTSDLQIEDYMRAESGRRKALAAIEKATK